MPAKRLHDARSGGLPSIPENFTIPVVTSAPVATHHTAPSNMSDAVAAPSNADQQQPLLQPPEQRCDAPSSQPARSTATADPEEDTALSELLDLLLPPGNCASLRRGLSPEPRRSAAAAVIPSDRIAALQQQPVVMAQQQSAYDPQQASAHVSAALGAAQSPTAAQPAKRTPMDRSSSRVMLSCGTASADAQQQLEAAILLGSKAHVAEAVAAGADVNGRVCSWATPLAAAAALGRTDIVQALLRCGAGIDKYVPRKRHCHCPRRLILHLPN